ncbi:hypothetical protein K435DRAFT_831452 [Dendrothele bispora CBS 962.96]|uniref:Uncharacterized protein n=1 Tax=Dendrothele bispora (strain CBS 962.96) TaxID=1314807 RepID=A0A4V4HCM6_DENBC|nr:hypothetical protein K435DRAFT_831452 [Dendrothele bispora CBS 962.96]
MSSEAQPESPDTSRGRGRGRGRGKSRGGLGKYLRARGRGSGRGYSGRPAEFHKRLLLEGEESEELDEEEIAEREEKYSRRQLGTNADRYKEEEPELDENGEPIVEPEVDLTAFLERQRISDGPGPSSTLKSDVDVDEDDVDYSVAQFSTKPAVGTSNDRKGKVQQIEWDERLEDLMREKTSADATRDLKHRFREKSENLRRKPVINVPARERKQEASYVDAPPLPVPENAKPKSQMEEMEDFLDELLG